ncbi:family 2 glycosyl transferase [Calothrix sp. NIES-4101]|nr:family 2 glycosyl transferase [Calothrix sp. NIES-4101]
MLEQPVVSIIINNYNYDRFLAEAIDSALNQTYSHVEVIVVDDGSTDKSREIIACYGDRIMPIYQENGKQGKAFNSGFAASRGNIIIFLDSDDFLLPQAVEKVVAVWKPNIAKVHYRLTVVGSTGESMGYSLPQGGQPLAEGEVWRILLEGSHYAGTPTSGNALNRKAMEHIFPIPDKYKLTSDDYLSTLIPFYGEVVAVEESLGVYRIHDSNQWALATLSADRFRRFLLHDAQAQALIIGKYNELGYKLPDDFELRSVGRFRVRLVSLRLDLENHQYPDDKILCLIYLGIRSLWKYSNYNPQKRIIHSLWFLWVGIMPLPLAKTGVTWFYAPHYRPKTIDWALKKVRALVT